MRISKRLGRACEPAGIDEEDVMRFDHGVHTFAIYRSPDDEYFAADDPFTHGKGHLVDGLVIDDIIERAAISVGILQWTDWF